MKAMKEGAVDQTEMDELVMMLEDMVKRQEKDEKKEAPKVEVTLENYTVEMLDSETFKEFLKKHDLEIVAKSMFEKTSVTPQVEEPEPDIYDVLLQDLKANREPDEKSDGDEDLMKELIALLKS
jgi:hypothetical protein